MRFKDSSYQGHWPVRIYYAEKKWAGLRSVSGTAYFDARKVANQNFQLAQAALNGATVTLLKSEEAEPLIKNLEAQYDAVNQAILARQTNAQNARDQIIAKLKSAAKGDEDSCQGNTPFADGMTVTCQLLGASIELPVIKQNGWLITNASTIGDKVILSVRKAR